MAATLWRHSLSLLKFLTWSQAQQSSGVPCSVSAWGQQVTNVSNIEHLSVALGNIEGGSKQRE